MTRGKNQRRKQQNRDRTQGLAARAGRAPAAPPVPSLQQTTLTQATLTHFSGPVPAPDTLREYEVIVPGAAQRILQNFQDESAHRRKQENRLVLVDGISTLGQCAALVITILAITGGIWLIHDDKSVAGLTLIIGDLAALAGLFILRQHLESKPPKS